MKAIHGHYQPRRWLLNSPMYCSIKCGTGLQWKTHQSGWKNKVIGMRNIFNRRLKIKTFRCCILMSSIYWDVGSGKDWNVLGLSDLVFLPKQFEAASWIQIPLRLRSPLFLRVWRVRSGVVRFHLKWEVDLRTSDWRVYYHFKMALMSQEWHIKCMKFIRNFKC